MQIEKMKIQYKKKKNMKIDSKDNNNKDKTVTEEIIEKDTKST